MRYLRKHSAPSDTIFAPPTFALFTPAFTGRPVYYGHWSETPDYSVKLMEWFGFFAKSTTDEDSSSRSCAGAEQNITCRSILPGCPRGHSA